MVTSIMTTTAIGLSNVSLYNYFGQLASDSYEKMGNSLYEMNWYELPIDLQKSLFLMMANVQ